MKKNVLQAVLGLSVAISLGCKKIQNEDFELSLSSEELELVDGKQMSCVSTQSLLPTQDISAISSTLQAMTIVWNSDTPLSIQYVKFIFDSGLKTQGWIAGFNAGPELNAIWMGDKSIQAVLPKGTSKSKCAFAFGSIPVPDANQAAFGTGRVIVYGTSDDGSGPKPAVATSFFSYSYLGNE